MRKLLFPLLTLILATLLLTACGAGNAESGIEVRQALVGPGGQGEDSPMYLALHNHDSKADQLTGVSSEAAEAVQLHNSTEVVEFIPVDANREFVFVPDGYHVMLIRLKRELQVGDEIEITLHFRDHTNITLKVPVREAAEHGDGDH